MNSAILFAKAMIGMQAVIYSLVMFNEAWLINTGIFTICFAMSLLRVWKWMDEEMDIHWLALIGLFEILIYGSIGYKMERL